MRRCRVFSVRDLDFLMDSATDRQSSSVVQQTLHLSITSGSGLSNSWSQGDVRVLLVLTGISSFSSPFPSSSSTRTTVHSEELIAAYILHLINTRRTEPTAFLLVVIVFVPTGINHTVPIGRKGSFSIPVYSIDHLLHVALTGSWGIRSTRFLL